MEAVRRDRHRRAQSRSVYGGFWNDKQLRGLLPDIPIILYDLVYLGREEVGAVAARRKSAMGIPNAGNFGLERYDWYLSISVVSEHGLPKGKQRLSVIGVDLDDGSLRAGEQNGFVALLDFQRGDHLDERRMQIQALTEANVKWIELRGEYSTSKIRAIYRNVAHISSRTGRASVSQFANCRLVEALYFLLTPSGARLIG